MAGRNLGRAEIAENSAGERRVALVIGNSSYRHAGFLPNPLRDAASIASALTGLGFKVLTGFDLDKRRFERTIHEFSDHIENADVGLLYYAGQGLQVDDVNYFVPTDAELQREKHIDFHAVPLGLIQRQLEREVRTSIIILDACRNNPLARSLSHSMGTRAVAVGHGLAMMKAGEGSFIAFATAPGNEAADGEGDHSPFTCALLEELELAGVSISDMMISVRNKVIRATANRQVPWDQSAGAATSFVGRTCIRCLRIAARIEEVVGLRREDVVLDHPVPHILIRFHHKLGRGLKKPSSERVVPLVGMALLGARQAMAQAINGASGWLFPRYASDGQVKNTHASNAVNRWISKRIDNTSHGLRARHAPMSRRSTRTTFWGTGETGSREGMEKGCGPI